MHFHNMPPTNLASIALSQEKYMFREIYGSSVHLISVKSAKGLSEGRYLNANIYNNILKISLGKNKIWRP